MKYIGRAHYFDAFELLVAAHPMVEDHLKNDILDHLEATERMLPEISIVPADGIPLERVD